jgi:hypothetical protein
MRNQQDVAAFLPPRFRHGRALRQRKRRLTAGGGKRAASDKKRG